MFIKEINIKRRQLSHDDKIGDKIVESLSSNWVTLENKTIHTLPLPSIQIWGVCCFLQEARTAEQHCMRWVGEGKLYFTLLKWAKCQKGPFGQTVSTNFAADYRFKTA